MATRKRDRVFAGLGALLFLVTASTLTILVIITMVQQHNASKQDDGATSTPASQTAVKNDSSTQTDQNKETKQLQGTKLADFTPVSKIDKLQTIDLKEGSGPAVQPGDTVTVDYTGAVAATGIIFQSSLDSGQKVSFPLDGVIEGWQKGIPGMKVGGTRRLLIPAPMAYGGTPPPNSGIPANADLVFDVTLYKIGQ